MGLVLRCDLVQKWNHLWTLKWRDSPDECDSTPFDSGPWAMNSHGISLSFHIHSWLRLLQSQTLFEAPFPRIDSGHLLRLAWFDPTVPFPTFATPSSLSMLAPRKYKTSNRVDSEACSLFAVYGRAKHDGSDAGWQNHLHLPHNCADVV